MRKLALVAVAFAALFAVDGCKKKSATSSAQQPAETPHERHAKAAIEVMNEVARILDGIRDEASGKAAVPQLDVATSKMQDLRTQFKALARPEPEEKKRLEATFGEQIDDAESRMRQALKQALKNGGPAFEEAAQTSLARFR